MRCESCQDAGLQDSILCIRICGRAGVQAVRGTTKQPCCVTSLQHADSHDGILEANHGARHEPRVRLRGHMGIRGYCQLQMSRLHILLHSSVLEQAEERQTLSALYTRRPGHAGTSLTCLKPMLAKPVSLTMLQRLPLHDGLEQPQQDVASRQVHAVSSRDWFSTCARRTRDSSMRTVLRAACFPAAPRTMCQ